MRTDPLIDLIIPARNEAMNIAALAAAVPWRQLRRAVLVDNGSKDNTAALAAAAGFHVLHEPCRGYGAACLRALNWIQTTDAWPQPDIVVFVDADLADDPALLPTLWAPIGTSQADLVIGSRVKYAQPRSLTAVQQFGNALSCRLIRLLTGHAYSDLGPMRAVAYPALLRLGMADRTWGWTVEMQLKAAMLGLRVREVDVPYRSRQFGRSKISGSVAGSVRAGTRILWTIAKVRMQRQSLH